MARIKVSSAKAKGRKLQQFVAQKIADITGCAYGKDEDIESRPMGQSGTDVILRGKAKDLFSFAVECKAQESWSVHSWIEQAQKNTGRFKTWLLFAKRKNHKPVIIMDAEEFFKLYQINIDVLKLPETRKDILEKSRSIDKEIARFKEDFPHSKF